MHASVFKQIRGVAILLLPLYINRRTVYYDFNPYTTRFLNTRESTIDIANRPTMTPKDVKLVI